jgi:hypothetical protein
MVHIVYLRSYMIYSGTMTTVKSTVLWSCEAQSSVLLLNAPKTFYLKVAGIIIKSHTHYPAAFSRSFSSLRYLSKNYWSFQSCPSSG